MDDFLIRLEVFKKLPGKPRQTLELSDWVEPINEDMLLATLPSPLPPFVTARIHKRRRDRIRR